MIRQEFNTGWSVSQRGSMFERGSSEMTAVELPHDAMRSAGRLPDGVAHLGYYRDGTWQYAKSFNAPPEWSSRRVTLEFEGAYRDAMVFVNGAFAGQCANGYVPFYVPLDPFLNRGGANEIVVEVQAHHDTRWYSGAGLYRPVNLLVGGLVHIPPAAIRVRTPQIDDAMASVEVGTEIVNDSPLIQTLRANLEVRGPAGDVVATDVRPITLLAGEKAILRQRCYVSQPRLWSAETPDLYSAKVTIRGDEGSCDQAETTFGIRTVTVDPARGLRINGQEVKLRGACLHHDHGILGTAEFERAAQRRMAIVKAAGFNAVRSAAHPASRAILDAADRLGLYVLDETWDMWHMSKTIDDYSRRFDKWWMQDVDAIVAKDFNRPSVIGYSLGSEIIEVGTRHGGRMARLIAERIRSQDPSRFITNAINSVMNMWVTVPGEPVVSFETPAAEVSATSADGDEPNNEDAVAEGPPPAAAEPDQASGGDNSFNETAQYMEAVSVMASNGQRLEEAAGAVDVFGLNYGHQRFHLDKSAFPNRIMLSTETFPAKIADYWKTVLDNPQVIGDFTWVGWDYLGEPGTGRPLYPDEPTGFTAPWPWLTADCADIDLIGQRLPISFYREIVFGLRRAPYLAIQNPTYRDHPMRPSAWSWSDTTASWTWPIAEGTRIMAEAYADADDVAFLVNGVEAARAPVGVDMPFVATAEIAYAVGRIDAIAYAGGVEIGRCALESIGEVKGVQLTSDNDSLAPDGQDLVFVEIDLVDAAGAVNPMAELEVTVEVKGPAVLQGLGSARPKTDEAKPFIGHTCTTYRGRALAAIRYAGANAPVGGPITVTVKSAGLPNAQLTFSCLPARGGDPQ